MWFVLLAASAGRFRFSATLGALVAFVLCVAVTAVAPLHLARAWPGDADGAVKGFASAKSAIVNERDEPLRARPDAAAERRGSAALGAALPLFGARPGPGCASTWLLVGPHAWLCADAAQPSRAEPIPAASREPAPTASGLAYSYFFVGPNGSSGYARLETAEIDEPVATLEPGFAVAVVQRARVGREAYARTGAGVWVPFRDLSPASPSAFQGAVLADGEAPEDVAWVVEARARVYAADVHGKPSVAAKHAARSDGLVRFERLRVVGEAALGAEKLLRVELPSPGNPGSSAFDGFVRPRDVRRPTRAPAPPEVNLEAGERWIDVELATQTLVAYEGAKPVFATLVSTGKGRQGSANATPLGTHRIWVKLATAHMDNLEDERASRFWRMENVPWVQYFSKGVGLHGAFWHKSFGHVRSHGCVNLAPRDAERLFAFTGPRLPAGWTAVLPSRHDRATVVRVR